ncbi:hypothetical protein HBB16_12040 [Pseudonocardia sp. MCCB 268]|nr:hypothetical protein [Pseudonocardia cytotoxica]
MLVLAGDRRVVVSLVCGAAGAGLAGRAAGVAIAARCWSARRGLGVLARVRSGRSRWAGRGAASAALRITAARTLPAGSSNAGSSAHLAGECWSSSDPKDGRGPAPPTDQRTVTPVACRPWTCAPVAARPRTAWKAWLRSRVRPPRSPEQEQSPARRRPDDLAATGCRAHRRTGCRPGGHGTVGFLGTADRLSG